MNTGDAPACKITPKSKESAKVQRKKWLKLLVINY